VTHFYTVNLSILVDFRWTDLRIGVAVVQF